jgi:hypothetical protein
MATRSAVLLILACALLAPSGAAADVATLKVKNLKVLVPIYRGEPGSAEYIDDAHLGRIERGLETGREFYWRSSLCRLNCELVYMPIDGPAPETAGPTYEFIEADLRARGVHDNDYDGVLTTGVGMKGNFGGFRILGDVGAAFGIPGAGEPLASYPGTDPDVEYDTAWIFAHEFEHALDLVICESAGHPEMLHAHPYADIRESYFKPGHHAGQHWDWIGHCLRTFDAYPAIGARREIWEVADADGDGMPDDDPRLPMDEKRFGSDPAKPDTDGDGLGDREEYTAGVYHPSDPNDPDTDGDGIIDGKDQYPLVRYAASVPYAATPPAIDGQIDSVYAPLIEGVYRSTEPDAGDNVVAYACWDEDDFYLGVRAPRPCQVGFMIDTSGENGFWEGGDTYLINVSPDAKVTFGGLGLDGDVPGAEAVWNGGTLELRIPAALGQGVSRNINYGGNLLPEDVAKGMVLDRGRVISTNLNLYFPDTRTRALLIPNWVMYDTTLTKLTTDPERPSLRYSDARASSATPVVQVSGVNATTFVEVVDQRGRVVGARCGNGPAALIGVAVGHDAESGRNVLRARTASAESEPFVLVVDAAAEAPSQISMQGPPLIARAEPGALVEVFWSRDGVPIEPIGSVEADDQGVVSWPIPQSIRGFLARYYNGDDFSTHVFTRIDPKIEFQYDAGSPDRRIDAEGFSIKWTGYLWIEGAGDYTFYLTTDDGSRLYTDGERVVDHWGHHGPIEKTGTVHLDRGWHAIAVDYYEEYGWAAAHLEWSGPGIERTYALPVAAILWDPNAEGLPADMPTLQVMLRQRDTLGNVSPFSEPVTLHRHLR